MSIRVKSNKNVYNRYDYVCPHCKAEFAVYFISTEVQCTACKKMFPNVLMLIGRLGFHFYGVGGHATAKATAIGCLTRWGLIA